VWLLTQDGGKTAQLQGDHEGWSGLYHEIRWNVAFPIRDFSEYSCMFPACAS